MPELHILVLILGGPTPRGYTYRTDSSMRGAYAACSDNATTKLNTAMDNSTSGVGLQLGF